jgi:hypothetical protein
LRSLDSITVQPVLHSNHRGFQLVGGKIICQHNLIHFQTVEAPAIHCIPIPLERGGLGSLGTHAGRVTILIADTAMCRELARGLVMPFFRAVVTLDVGFLWNLHLIHGLGKRRLDSSGTLPWRRLWSWGIRSRRRPRSGRVLPDPHLLPLDLLLLVGRASFEPHVILSTAVLIVTPLWRTIAVPVMAGLPLPPTMLFFCALAKHSLQPTPIVGVEVVEGTLGACPEFAAAAVHRRR